MINDTSPADDDPESFPDSIPLWSENLPPGHLAPGRHFPPGSITGEAGAGAAGAAGAAGGENLPPFLNLAASGPYHPLETHEWFMRQALDLARLAFETNEVPVGAVIVLEGRIIAAAHNQREMLHDPTAHAEMIAITQAAEYLQSWRLIDCTLYVTLEPCPMCAGAAIQARIPTIIYGTTDPKAGACHTLYQITSDPRLNHQCQVLAGVLAGECRDILQQFFKAQRALGKK